MPTWSKLKNPEMTGHQWHAFPPMELQIERMNILALLDLATACKHISFTVDRGAITGMLGASNSTNVKVKPQLQRDIITNDILVDSFSWTGYLARKLYS